MEENNQKENKIYILPIILLVIIIALGGYFIWDKAIRENPNRDNGVERATE